ncbi:putative ATP-dependent helicase IRC3 [Candida viswanathii]|nr:putative ATP-dependent helicase IRC3 [Candida viswanathii]
MILLKTTSIFIAKRILIPIRLAHSFALRDYQQEAIDKVLAAARAGVKRQAVVMATGGGKTVVFSHLIPLLEGNKGTKTLVLAHTQELIFQSRDKISMINPDLKVGVEMAHIRSNEDDDVVVASVSSLARLGRFEKFSPDVFKTIIIDECHHAVAASYRRILDYFNAGSKDTDVNVIGVTATLHRADQVKLGLVFDEIVYDRSLKAMIENGELCDFKVSDVSLKNLDLDSVKKDKGDYDSTSLYSALSEVGINEQAVLSYLKMVEEGEYKSTLVFCVSIEHCRELCGLFQTHGIDAQYVSANTTKVERADIVEDFKNGKIPVLCNVGVFTEGTDIPNIDSIILARPTLSDTLKIQMIGRGLRHHPGKTHCHVVDLVLLTRNGLNALPSLSGIDEEDATNGKKRRSEQEEEEAALEHAESLSSIAERREYVLRRVLNYHNHGATNFFTVNGLSMFKDYFSDPMFIRDFFMKSPYCWVALKFGKSKPSLTDDAEYVWGLSGRDNEYFLVEMTFQKNNPVFKISRNSDIRTGEAGRVEIECEIITDGVHKLLDHFKEKYPVELEMSRKSKVFHRKATPDQVKYLLALLEGKITRDCLIFNRDKAKFVELVKQEIEKIPLFLSSSWLFASKYSPNSFYASVKSRTVLLNASRKYHCDKKPVTGSKEPRGKLVKEPRASRAKESRRSRAKEPRESKAKEPPVRKSPRGDRTRKPPFKMAKEPRDDKSKEPPVKRAMEFLDNIAKEHRGERSKEPPVERANELLEPRGERSKEPPVEKFKELLDNKAKEPRGNRSNEPRSYKTKRSFARAPPRKQKQTEFLSNSSNNAPKVSVPPVST